MIRFTRRNYKDMSVKIEKVENGMATLTVTVPAADFNKAITSAYNRTKGRFNIPGFRKGKASQYIIEKMYGPGVFYEDAANECINKSYPNAVDEAELDVVAYPEIMPVQMEKGKDFIYTVEVAVKPEVKLGNYMAVEVSKQDVTVTDEDVEKELQSEQKKNARKVEITDRPVADGDTINLDYAGTVDGVAFDGGTAKGQSLRIGSGTFIPGFEEQLIGVSAGESKDVVVTFPEEYHAPDLAGKEATFACTVNSIQGEELPEIDDDFAQDVSETANTVEELKEELRKVIFDRKSEAAKTAKENEAVEKAVAASEIEILDVYKKAEAENIFEDYARQLQSQGIPVDEFLKYQGSDREKFIETLLPEAERRIRSRLTLEAIAKAENLEITDEEVEAEITKMSEQYGMTTDQIRSALGESGIEQLRKDSAMQKAISLIADNAIEV